MIVVDASPLIALNKIGKLVLLKELYGEIAIAPAVRIEVIERGKMIGASGAQEVAAGIAARWIREVSLNDEAQRIRNQLSLGTRLGDGEAESIALACSLGLTLVVDDREARNVAKAMGTSFLGTAGVLLEAFARKCLSFGEFEEVSRDLGKVLWLSPDVVAEILKRARG